MNDINDELNEAFIIKVIEFMDNDAKFQYPYIEVEISIWE